MELSSWSVVVSKPFLVVLIVTSGLLNLPRAAGTNCNTRLTIIPDVEISTSPPTTKLAIGTAVNLTCLAQPRGIDAVYYDRWTEYIQWYDPQGKPVGHRCVQGRRMVLKHRCTLMLKHLTAEQLGSYTCEAGNGYLAHCRRKSVEIRPKETQTIQIIEDPKNQSSLIGSIVTFNCTATGSPRPTISWEKNDDPYALQTNPRVEEKVIVLDNKAVRSQLLLTGTEMEDNGKYHCVANNSAGERISRVSFLDLQPIQDVGDPKNQSAVVGFGEIFICITRSHPKPSISCVQSNNAHSTQSTPTTNFHPSDTPTVPQIVEDRWNLSIVIGSDVTLNCITTGHLLSTSRWIKNNNSYFFQSYSRAKITRVRRDQTTHYQLSIEKVKKKDGGKYQCIANNIAGDETSVEVNLHVNQLDLKSESRTLAGRTGLTIFQLTVIAFGVSTFVFAVGAFLWDRRPVKISKLPMSSLQKSDSPSHV